MNGSLEEIIGEALQHERVAKWSAKPDRHLESYHQGRIDAYVEILNLIQEEGK